VRDWVSAAVGSSTMPAIASVMIAVEDIGLILQIADKARLSDGQIDLLLRHLSTVPLFQPLDQVRFRFV
jgi:hypothetical protein